MLKQLPFVKDEITGYLCLPDFDGGFDTVYCAYCGKPLTETPYLNIGKAWLCSEDCTKAVHQLTSNII